MKKILKLFILALVIINFVVVGCKKEVGKSKEMSNAYEDAEGLFKKEIVVSDKSGKNKAFYAVYSDDEELLNNFINSYNFVLEINENDKLSDKMPQVLSDNTTQEQIDYTQFNLDEEPAITVELVLANIQDDVKNYTLELQRKKVNTKDYIMDAVHVVAFDTKNDFIGVIHDGSGYCFGVRFRYKLHWYSSWKGNTLSTIEPTGAYYAYMDESWDVYKRAVVIYPDIRQGQQVNYRIVYDHDNFRGTYCRIGTYDYNNFGECYVGSSPVGTQAFIWHSKFYYTPVNGNQCPRPGSHFDGANCYVMDIPAGCEAYTWRRNWLVKSELID